MLRRDGDLDHNGVSPARECLVDCDSMLAFLPSMFSTHLGVRNLGLPTFVMNHRDSTGQENPTLMLSYSQSPFINQSSYKSSKAVARSSGFHCSAIRSHLRNPSLSSPWMFSARLSRVMSGIGATSFQFPDSSQKAVLRCL